MAHGITMSTLFAAYALLASSAHTALGPSEPTPNMVQRQDQPSLAEDVVPPVLAQAEMDDANAAGVVGGSDAFDLEPAPSEDPAAGVVGPGFVSENSEADEVTEKEASDDADPNDFDESGVLLSETKTDRGTDDADDPYAQGVAE